MKTSFREIIQTITFIGVVFHEFGHKLFCDLSGVKVHKICYFRFGNPAGYVIHEAPKKFGQAFFIAVGPLISGAFFAVLFYYLSTENYEEAWLKYFFIWLGASIATNSFPSSTDARSLWNDTNKYILKNPLAIFGYPFALIIWIANALTVIWIEIIYAVLLYYFVVNAV